MRSILKIGLCYDASAIIRSPATLPPGLDLIIFPELVDGGYSSLYGAEAPHTLTDNFVGAFRQISRKHATTVIAGSLYLKDGSSAGNISLVFSYGRLRSRYAKIHLFRPAGDHRYFRAGKHLTAFSVPCTGVTAGVNICFDLRFPELARVLARKGVSILFVPARWPLVRDDAWYTLLKARAIENQIFTVGCNAKGKEGGYSYVFDPMGRQLFSNRKRLNKRLDIVKLDLKTIDKARKPYRNLHEATFLKNHFTV